MHRCGCTPDHHTDHDAEREDQEKKAEPALRDCAHYRRLKLQKISAKRSGVAIPTPVSCRTLEFSGCPRQSAAMTGGAARLNFESPHNAFQWFLPARSSSKPDSRA